MSAPRSRHRPTARLGRALAVTAALAAPAVATAADRAPIVAVAANMTAAAEQIAERFRERGGERVRLSFGASGNLARQIERGAPFELFLSADEDYVDRLVAAGRTTGGGTVYAIGRLALYLRAGSPLALPDGAVTDEAGVAQLLRDPRLERLAIANPAHAPYGRAAEQVLVRLGLLAALRPRLVLGENVTQAARFAVSAGVQGALLPYSIVRSSALAGGRHLLLPESWHAPVRQRLVLMAGAGAIARAFRDFVLGDEAREIIARHGYALPPRD